MGGRSRKGIVVVFVVRFQSRKRMKVPTGVQVCAKDSEVEDGSIALSPSPLMIILTFGPRVVEGKKVV